MPLERERTPLPYKAFISYSHESDGDFADALHDAMEKLAKPWTKRRARRVALDRTAMSAGSSLSDTIEEKLADSEWLVLLASPESAQSKWVGDEIDYWVANKLMDNVVVVLTAGEIVVDPRTQRVDWDRSSALSGRFRAAVGDKAVPLYEDMRPFKVDIDRVKLRNAHFRDEVAKIVGRIEGEDPGELASEEKRQYARSVRLRRIAEIALVILTAAAVFLGIRATVSERRAVENERIAIANEQRAILEAERATSGAIAARSVATLPEIPDLAALLALEGLRTAPTVDAFISVINAVVSPTNFLWRTTVPQEPIVGAAAWSTDGQIVAMGTEFGEVWLLSPDDGVLAIADVSDTASIVSVAFSDDGALRVLDTDGWLTTWDPASASRTAGIWLGEMLGGVISGDGSTVAVVADQFTIVVFDDIGARIATLELVVGFSEDCVEGNPCVITISDDGTAVAWGESDEVEDVVWRWTGEASPALVLTTTDTVTSLAFTPSGGTLLAAEDDGDAHLLPGDDESPTPFDTEPDLFADAEFFSFSFADLGTEVLVASGHLNGSVKLWTVDEETGIGSLKADLVRHDDEVRSVALSPDGSSILSGGWDGDIIAWTSAAGARHGVTTQDAHQDRIGDVTFVGKDALLASVSHDGTVALWQTDGSGNLAPVGSFVVDDEAIPLSIDAAPDGATIAVGVLRFVGEGDDVAGSVLVYEVESGAQIATLEGPDGFPVSLAFSPDGSLLAASFSGGPTVVWGVEALDEPPRFEFESTASVPGAVAFSGDGALLAAPGPSGVEVLLWATATGALIATVPGNEFATVTAVALNGDGSILAWGDDTRLIGLWDVATDIRIGENLAGHREEITDLQFADLDNDGIDDLLASTSRDATARLWDIAAGRLVATIPSHRNDVSAVDISTDGSLMVTSGHDMALWVGDLDPETWVAAACALAGRNMSLSEWESLREDEIYVRHCRQFGPGEGAPADAAVWTFEFTGLDRPTSE